MFATANISEVKKHINANASVVDAVYYLLAIKHKIKLEKYSTNNRDLKNKWW
jgi:hypothetical protein